MLHMVRRVAAIAVVGLVVAGCQSVPPDYKPDPSLKTASLPKLQAKIADVCIKAQRQKGSVATSEISKPCGCYAGKALKAMDKTEIDFYREKGYFAESARDKAKAALNSCGLK